MINWRRCSRNIYRVNLDGSGTPDLVTDSDCSLAVFDLALDVGGGQMYWTSNCWWIQRANLDGSGVTDVVTDFKEPWSMALDLDAGHIYFTSDGPIPEPSTLTLAALGLVGLVIAALRRRDQSA